MAREAARWGRGVLIAAWLAAPAAALAQPPASRQAQEAALEKILQAEDARDADAIRQAMAAGAHRRVGIRALGRLEQPELIRYVAPALSDAVGIRAEAAWALAQLARTPEAVAQVQPLLVDRAAQDAESGLWEVWGEMAAALGRLPYATAEQAALTEAVLAEHLPAPDSFAEPETSAVMGSVRGLEALVRVSGKVAVLQPRTWDRLRWSATSPRPPADPRSAWIRRLAMAALVSGGETTVFVIDSALADRDTEVRRLGAAAAGADGPLADRDRLLRRALTDADAQVRFEALRSWGRRLQTTTCAPIRAAVKDPDPHVMLQAVDLLGAPCPESEGPPTELNALIETPSIGPRNWHAPAHAFVALARRSPNQARRFLPRFTTHPIWQVRMYAARAAGAIGSVGVLTAFGSDPHPNVREAALSALIEAKRPEAADAALAALASDDHRLVLTATHGLTGPDVTPRAVPALLAALVRLTAQGKDTSRDPRMAILDRLQALGSRNLARALDAYLTDFDPAVAAKAADILSAWDGSPRTPAPRPMRAPAPTLAAIEELRDRRLRVTVAGRGSFDVALDVDFAPLSSARIAGRAGEGYYNGLTFHRVAPNFVIQGGSPGANEYAGDVRFMRDEVGLHRRGTVGISTRGRDTGDAQIFVNLVDSPRLDHQYTVFGTVVAGMEVVDGILEGDVIERVELVGP
ncbi:MAG TPA: peptidylprolyl isomerase [Vicinamibacterales bacterium]|nr:peptidylprolyl isomerase [Vicinamibacterales bacterium]